MTENKISRPPPKGWWKWPVGVLFAVGVIAAMAGPPKDDEQPRELVAPPSSIDAADVDAVKPPSFDYEEIEDAYKADEIQAERKFGDLYMVVSGPVRKVNSTLTGKATIWLGEDRDFFGTMVNLDRANSNYAAQLVPGIEITLACTGATSKLGTVSLQECTPAP